MNTKIRTLNAEEIEIRVQRVTYKGVSLLLYKNARADMVILDEVFGITGWQRKHEIINGNNYCTVSVRDSESGEWISKMDVGTETFADPVKGASSDAFKRACTNFGIGRELYSAPFIWIPAEKVNIQAYNGKYVVRDSFKVSRIEYDSRGIASIEIMNQKNEVIFSITDPAVKSVTRKSRKSKTSETGEKITSYQAEMFKNLLEEHSISISAVLKKHNLKSLEDMTVDLYNNAVLALNNTSAA